MWKCVFKTDTGIGSGFNREQIEGEVSVEIPKEKCGWFYLYPDRYKYVAGKLIERSEWVSEVAAKEAVEAQAILDAQSKAAEIETAKDSAGLGSIVTLNEAKSWIEKDFDKVDTVPAVIEATQKILLKILPYLMSIESSKSKSVVAVLTEAKTK